MSHAVQSARRVPAHLVLIGLLIVYGLNWAVPDAARALGLPLPSGNPLSVVLWNWLTVGVLIVFVHRVERLDLASLRIVRPTGDDLGWAVGFAGAAMGWSWAASMIAPVEQGTDTLVALGPLGVLLLLLTVATTEEILWRGYVVERLGAVLRSRAAACFIGLAIFAAGHVPFFGTSWLLVHGVGAALIYGLFWWRRNLPACMLTHLIVNAPVLLVTLFAA